MRRLLTCWLFFEKPIRQQPEMQAQGTVKHSILDRMLCGSDLKDFRP